MQGMVVCSTFREVYIELQNPDHWIIGGYLTGQSLWDEWCIIRRCRDDTLPLLFPCLFSSIVCIRRSRNMSPQTHGLVAGGGEKPSDIA
jgi:hypothetical protein